MFNIWVRILSFILQPRWIVFCTKDSTPVWELGLSVWGVTFALYKSNVYTPRDILTSREPMKREFNESLHPVEGYEKVYNPERDQKVKRIMGILTNRDAFRAAMQDKTIPRDVDALLDACVEP